MQERWGTTHILPLSQIVSRPQLGGQGSTGRQPADLSLGCAALLARNNQTGSSSRQYKSVWDLTRESKAKPQTLRCWSLHTGNRFMITQGYSMHGLTEQSLPRAVLCFPAGFTSETGSKIHALDIACRKKNQGKATKYQGRVRARV